MSLTSVEPPLDQKVADDKLLRLLLHSDMTAHSALSVEALLSMANLCAVLMCSQVCRLGVLFFWSTLRSVKSDKDSQ